MEDLKILNLTAAPPHFISGIVAFDFHKNLQKHGCDSKLLTMHFDDYDDDSIISYRKSKFDQPLKRALSLVKTKLDKNNSHPDFYFKNEDLTKSINSTQSILDRLNGFKPDIIIVHFALNFLTTQNIKELNEQTGAHIYWYFMDMRPMTGGCAYSWDCKKYQKNCGQCPALYSKIESDLSRKNLEFNKVQVEKTNLSVLVGSEMTRDQVAKSTVFKNKEIQKLYIAINSENFKPFDKASRISFAKKYNFQVDRFHLFFGAASPDEKRKGFDPLMKSLNLFKEKIDKTLHDKIHIIIAGTPNEILNNMISKTGFTFDNIGFLDHKELAKTLAFADLFLCPTLQDSGPMMVNQSLMAGTPVVSFEMGICIDLISEDKGTGALIELGNVESFAGSIHKLLTLSEETRRENRIACRNLAMEQFSYEAQFNTFKKIAEKVISIPSPSSEI